MSEEKTREWIDEDIFILSEESRKIEKFLRNNPDILKKFYIKIERNLWKKCLQWKIKPDEAKWALEVIKQLKNLFS